MGKTVARLDQFAHVVEGDGVALQIFELLGKVVAPLLQPRLCLGVEIRLAVHPLEALEHVAIALEGLEQVGRVDIAFLVEPQGGLVHLVGLLDHVFAGHRGRVNAQLGLDELFELGDGVGEGRRAGGVLVLHEVAFGAGPHQQPRRAEAGLAPFGRRRRQLHEGIGHQARPQNLLLRVLQRHPILDPHLVDGIVRHDLQVAVGDGQLEAEDLALGHFDVLVVDLQRGLGGELGTTVGARHGLGGRRGQHHHDDDDDHQHGKQRGEAEGQQVALGRGGRCGCGGRGGRFRGGGGLVVDKAECRPPDPDLVLQRERRAGRDSLAVEQDAVAAVQVMHVPDSVELLHLGVVARRLAVVEHDIVVFLAPEADARGLDIVVRAFVGTANADQLHGNLASSGVGVYRADWSPAQARLP